MNKFDKFSQIIQYSPTCPWRWNRQSVPKRQHIKFRRRGITQKKSHNNNYNWLYNLLGQILCYCNTKFWRKEEGKNENVSNIMEPYNTQAGTEPECIVHCNMNGHFLLLYGRASWYIAIVKPTRCTSFSNLFYFVVALYMFWRVLPSIIRSPRLYIKRQVYVKQILLTAC